jgi:hypothetical protein
MNLFRGIALYDPSQTLQFFFGCGDNFESRFGVVEVEPPFQ